MRTPFKCPVCGGRGIVDSDFYDFNEMKHISPATNCRSCCGSGIVWGEDIAEVDFEDFQSDDFMYNPDNNDNTSVT